MLNNNKLFQLLSLGIFCFSSLAIAKEENSVHFNGCKIHLPNGYHVSEEKLEEGVIKRIFNKNRKDIHSIELVETSEIPSHTGFENVKHIVQKDGLELIIIKLELKYVQTPKIVIVKNTEMELSFTNIEDKLVKLMLKGCLESDSLNAIGASEGRKQ